MKELDSLLEKITGVPEDISVNKVFGEPETFGEKVLIPIAEVTYGFAAAVGTSEPMDKTLEQQATRIEITGAADQDNAGGGGTAARVRPIAYIEVGPEGTSINPVEDKQKVMMAGILLVAWIFGWLGLVLKATSRK